MQRRKNRRSRKSFAPLHKPVRLSAIELLEARQLLTGNPPSGYLQVPLAADQAGQALLQDANLQNAWGVAISPGGGDVWVADSSTTVASRYAGAVTGSAFSGISSVAVPANNPTSIAFNPTADFSIGTGTNASHVLFFIASKNGEIDGWSTGNQAQTAVTVSGAEFTGLAVANNGTASFLYAADFHNGTVDVFNSNLAQTTLSATAFTDSALPAGYAPYNIQLMGGQLYVTYAKQDTAKQNPVVGAGNGVIDIYNLDGSFAKELVVNSELNVPYGLAMAPASFGDLAGDLLVANSGDGHILAYNTSGTTVAFKGDLSLAPQQGTSTAMTISGVRGLTFGNDSTAGNDTTLFYSAASGGHGQFGEILNAFQQPLVIVPTTVSSNQGQVFSGTLAALSDSNSSLAASNLPVTINWGDGTTGSGSVTSNGNGGFNVSGTHTYTTVGAKQVTITATDSSANVTGTATVSVTDPSFNPIGTTITATEGQSFSGLVGSFSDPTGPGSYQARINWGDGTTSSASTVTAGSGSSFNVTGSHTYTSVGSFTVAVTVLEVTSTTSTAAIGTVDSTATASDPNTLTATASTFAATEGQSTTTTVATFTDSNSSLAANPFTATINWGDGTTASAGTVTRGNDGVFTVTGSHAFAKNGTLTATVTISDTPGTATATASSIADVADGNTFTPQPTTLVANATQTFTGKVATFSDTNSLVRAADFTATIDWGDGSTGSVGSVTAANGVVTVSGTHTYAAGGASEPVSVVITENSPGTASATATSTAIVAANDLTGTGGTISATASAASSPQTLASFTPNSGNTDTFTATVDWGDGTSFTAATVVTATGSGGFNVVGSHTYAAPGNYAPQVIVYEASGTASPTPAEAITARANVASPIVVTPATITATEHTSSTLTVATFTDSEPSVTASDFTATVDWGDGGTATTVSVTGGNGAFTVAGVHSFAEAGTLNVSVTITEAAPTVFSTSASATATVAQDDSFTVSTSPSLTTTVGSPFSGTLATFTDTDLQTTAGQLTAVIDWGDGTQTAGSVTGSGGVFAVSSGSPHTYTHDGAFTVKVTIENNSAITQGFAETIATGTAMVSPTAFTATGTAITASEGSTFSGTVATFTDTGSSNLSTAFTATINWGDGTSSTTAVVSGASGSYTVSGNHLYTDGGSYQVTVDVAETAISDTISAVSTATVSGSDSLTPVSSTVTATAGTTFTGTVAGFTDSNTAAVAGDFTATISWGDGSTSTTGSVTGGNGAFTVTGQHLYSTAATDTVKVTISDVDLSTISATATSTADVVAATTTGATTGTISGTVFNDLTLSGVFQSGDPGLAGRKVFLNVDGSGTADGTNPQATTDANGNFTLTAPAAGSYQVMEVIPANDGQTLTTSVQTVTLVAGQTVTGVNIGNSITSTIVPVKVTLTPPPAATDANTAYINALYQTILGHAPDATGLAFWQQQLASGASHLSVAQGVWDSTEHRTEEVDEFYREFLNRAPDAAGEQFWVNAFNSWGTEQLEAVGFLTSTPEYMDLHSGNTAFVDALYNSIDQRPADSAGETNWVSQLGNGATPVQVALDFVFGQEAATKLVSGFYSAFLHRAPDAASLQMWVNDLDAQTMTADQVAIQLLASTEYFNRVTSSQAPTITSTTSTSFTAGTAGSFQVTTSGFPAPSITATGLPTDVTLTDNHNGTATLASTAAAAAGTYTLHITATNGVGTAATQPFTLTISTAQTQSAPAITSVASTTFAVGTAGTFSVTTTGSPTASISESGSLPSGVTFADNGNGTATLSGTPAASTAGTYPITITAHNGTSPDATQNFVLTVNAAPSITSVASTTYAVGTAGTFSVTTTGNPTASITESGSLPSGVTLVDNHNGTATLSGTPAAGTAGTYPITITAHNGVGTDATQPFTLTVSAAPAAPSITSVASTTFTEGTAGTFSVTTTGSPTASISKSGSLPSGVAFVDNGNGTATLSGTPAAGTAGTYPITITAHNSSSPDASQNFVLTVNAAPAAPSITSAASTTLTEGTVGTFSVTTTGNPTASITESGSLPSGVTLVDNHNGTATLSGTPAAGTAGTYPITITAHNGVGTDATQPFTLTVSAAPAAPSITSVASTTLTEGTVGTFSVTTTGNPTASITESGSLPSGVTFVDNGNGTATLSGTPAAGTAGTYPITITAHNGTSPDASQNFVLTVNAAPAAPSITSAASTTLTEGTAGTFSVTTTGNPTASITESGSLPSGVTFVDNGNGTATLSGTPAAGTAGTYPITITAHNSTSPDASQNFVLTVNTASAAPSITSQASTTFTEGTVGTFSVTTTGNPTASISESGSLPSGVTFVDNGNGTATLSGTPAAGTAGTYPITITAHNSTSPDASQNFVLTVNTASAAPSITSVASTTFAEGTAGTFSVTTTGNPTASISESGSLPSGVTFVDNGNGTATLSGTPAAGSAGTYPITITAHNGTSPDASQNFVLTVNAASTAPSITSVASTTFAEGTVGTFSVTTTGNPTASISESGSLPSGVTFVDNGNGTATLSGTPAAGSAGTYPITITAHNGTSPDASQNFVLTVNAASTAPSITSVASTTFAEGTAGTFSVTTTGNPTASISESGSLPSGVTFVDNGNGTATLSGTPAAGSAGTYPITITAHNGTSPDASQNFILTVNAAPAAPSITSVASTTFTEGTVGTFSVTTTGNPTASISESGSLPSGVTFVDNGNGTATLSGTPAAGSAGTYPITITAHNGTSPDASQNFVLTVNAASTAPSITSVASTTFAEGTVGTFSVTTTGNPTASISESGSLPSGVTFVDNGNGTATLSGTPAAGSAGTYPITITAHNGTSPDASQNFILTVNAAPAAPSITSVASTTFTEGTVGTFSVTTTGNPTASISESGSLPSGVTFVDNGNGTATLSGTPAAGSAGTYPITITAHNGTSPDASQNFVLTVNAASTAPSITSVASTTFAEGTVGTFSVTTTGNPTASISESGSLPSGVTFVDNGNGTATLSGTPAAGSAGTYPITITAHNGVGTDATQSFTLTVGTAPAFSSNSSATFIAGTPGSFTVTTTGTPTASITATGFPADVTVTDNNNGTATVASNANAAAGVYTFNITANNGVGTGATQTFTLTIGVPPAITSNNSATFTVGTPGSFTVTTTGTPTDSITATGLPANVTLNDNGDGSATLASSALALPGTYHFTITAHNGVGSDASQPFTLTIS